MGHTKKPLEPAEKHREYRLDRVIGMLTDNPGIRLGVMTDASLPDILILAIAIRGLAAFEMHVPKNKFDAFDMLWLINKEGGDVTE